MHRAISYIAGLFMALLSFVFLGQVNALPVVEDNKVLSKRTYSNNCPTNEINVWNQGCQCIWPFQEDSNGNCGLVENSLCLVNKNCQSNSCQVTKKFWGIPIKQCVANNAGGEQR